METLIIVSGIILAVAVGVYYALRQQAKAHLEITEQFDKIQSRLGTEYTSINPDFVYIIQEAARQQATALEMQNQVSNLAFPIIECLDTNDDSAGIIDKLRRVIDEKSLFWAGTEQVIFTLLPPEQLVGCMDFALEVLGEHATATMRESVLIAKQGISEGLTNLQHSDTLRDCFFELIKAAAQLDMPDHIARSFSFTDLIERLLPEHHQSLFSHVILASDVLDPAFHFTDHGTTIKNAALSHGKLALHSIHDHASKVLHKSIGGHIPYITIFLSSMREIRLLDSKKTDFQTSIKNLALDTAGTAGGAIGGAKAGAIAGSFLGPIGTAVGGVIGAIAGGIGGRYLTDNIKKRDYKQAVESYLAKHEAMVSDLTSTALTAHRNTTAAIDIARLNFGNAVSELKGPLSYVDQTVAELHEIVELIADEINNSIAEVGTLKELPHFKSHSQVQQILSYEKELADTRQLLIRIGDLTGLADIVGQIQVSVHGGFFANQDTHISYFMKRNRGFAPMALAYGHACAKLYQDAHAGIISCLNEQADRYSSTSSYWHKELKKSEEIVLIEKAKLG